LEDVDIVDIFKLESVIGTVMSLPEVLGRRIMAKVSDIVVAPLQEWRRGGQTSKAQERKSFEEHIGRNAFLLKKNERLNRR
jgi:hypothetical protein